VRTHTSEQFLVDDADSESDSDSIYGGDDLDFYPEEVISDEVVDFYPEVKKKRKIPTRRSKVFKLRH
jgi:hypothetical protein